MSYSRGDIVVLIAPGDFGKPRPAIIIQADLFNSEASSYTVCLFTTELKETPIIRPTVIPTATNGLKETGQIMADKVMTVKAERVRQKIGVLSRPLIRDLEKSLRLWLAL